MNNKVIKPDFFKTKTTKNKICEEERTKKKPENKNSCSQKNIDRKKNNSKKADAKVPVKINTDIVKEIKDMSEFFTGIGKKNFSMELEKIYRDTKRDKFTISVVGEFSRGKSTFINNLLGKEFLPVGDLPTTAMLTYIRYSKKEMMVLIDKIGTKKGTYPLSQDSWEGLTANNFNNNEPEGTVFAAVDSDWLGMSNLEIIDTPGAGDLEEKRARQIGDALVGSDGAIITVSALQALSQSEKTFIEQRLITNKTPYLMLIITKLDQVNKRERGAVVKYIMSKLDLWKEEKPEIWKTEIPVFIPYNVEIPDNQFADIMGMDNVKKQINIWQADTKRIKLTERWIISRAVSVIDTALYTMNEQKQLFTANEEKRLEFIKRKKEALARTEESWEKLRIEMRKRSNDCYKVLLEKIDECKVSVTERLQYEVSHSNDLAKWWKEDYPYRLRAELANTSVVIENTVSKIISNDMRWFNAMLEKSFKTHVAIESETIADKNIFKNSAAINDIEIENIDSKRNIMRIGITAASLAGAMFFMSAGFLPLIATMGVGTGGSILSEKIFKQKIEQQRENVRQAIGQNVPKVMDSATSTSERKITEVYEDILKESKRQEEIWMQEQRETIEKSNQPITSEEEKKLDENINILNDYKSKLLCLQK